MGRQFRFYLLPTDVERVVQKLREEFGAVFLKHASPSSSPMQVDTVFRTSEAGVKSVDCYFAMSEGARIKTWYAEKRGEWLIDTDSEVIEFSGCYFNGAVLLAGRLYYQPNFVVRNEFQDKSPVFVRWAEQVFRATKKDLTYSTGMMAYVGADAMHWHTKGGPFASLRRADGTYAYEPY